MSSLLYSDEHKIASALADFLGLKPSAYLYDDVPADEFGLSCGDPEWYKPQIEVHLPDSKRILFSARLDVSVHGIRPELCVEFWEGETCVYSSIAEEDE